MNQEEMKALFSWCTENLRAFRCEQVEESEHYYLNDVFIGGWAGDSQSYFYEHSDTLARAIRMMDAEKSVSQENENNFF